MGISHSWNGTILTITSDSGTSSADLKGDMGIRGPQGRTGLTLTSDGVIDTSGLATESYVDTVVNNAIEGIEHPTVEVPKDYAMEIVNSATGEVISLTDSSNRELKGLCVYGKSVQDGTPSPDSPVDIVSCENVVVTVTGKNLFDGVLKSGYRESIGGSLVAAGGVYNTIDLTLPVSGTYTITFPVSTFIIRTNGSQEGSVGYIHKAQLNAGENYISFRKEDNTNWVDTDKIQVEYGENSTEYDLYKFPQALTISTTNGLCGIPVSSGGNYTDSTGQQWICDYVDFEKGVYVQRVNAVELNNFTFEYNSDTTGQALCRALFTLPANVSNLSVTHGAMCNKLSELPYAYINGTKGSWFGIYRAGVRVAVDGATTVEEVNTRLGKVTIAYPLEEEITHNLTEEQLTAFRALHTNKPNTTIYTDSTAGLKVDYVADTKLYIDNKFNELATALLAN